jgi:two-component system nitrogen regulation sensor histidine kinase NtrY
MQDSTASTPVVRPKTRRRLSARIGPVAVGIALFVTLGSFIVFAGYSPIAPTNDVLFGLFVANVVTIVILFALILAEAYALYRAWRAQIAGTRLHLRIVGLFSIIAAVPAILMALVGSITLERSLNPVFMQDVRGFVLNTVDAARLFSEGQCKSLLQEASLTASDLDRGKVMYSIDRSLFHEFFRSRATFLGFTAAAIMKPDGTIIDRIDTGAKANNSVVQPEPNDFQDAKKSEPLCLILDEGATFVALRPLSSFDDSFLYVARPVDPFTVAFPREAAHLVGLYDAFDGHRQSIQIAFATMYVSVALVMMLGATWFGLSFANQLATPIRRLIAATDEVATGNLNVEVPVRKEEGDLAHLGTTFNKMTSELRLQQNRLIAASNLIDERRLFTEAVLSGVPVAVVGVDAMSKVTVLNSSAEKLVFGETTGETGQGRPIGELLPELTPILDAARNSNVRLMNGQVALNRAGQDRQYNVRVTSEPTTKAERGFVVTLDDITDLVSAQRTAAWADVARRIAHEIKNPLTPIQLSAERLKRKYGRLITQDRDIFDQCTDTIVRQVDDIKRMVDEFSSFARMPKARLEPDDLADCARRILFLMRVAHPDIEIEDNLPDAPYVVRFDRRLLSQALTNIIKNATEGIATRLETDAFAPHLSLTLHTSEKGEAVVDVDDNGKGFPVENRQRLLEPYMTTRAEGTGLGLPIVAKILEDHGGGLDLLDAPGGQGARVRLRFPVGMDHLPDDHSSSQVLADAAASS